MSEENDFGFTTVKPPTVVIKADTRLEQVKNLILPLINNLMKDPDKDIHWPNRDVKLKEFKKRLLDIINDEGELL